MKPSAELHVEVTVPPEYEAEVLRDLQHRGGTVSRTDSVRVIRGTIPSGGAEGYGDDLRSITAGHGTFRAYAPQLTP